MDRGDWRSKLRSKPNSPARRAKGYAKSVDMLKRPLAIALEECLNKSLIYISTISAAGWEYPSQHHIATTKKPLAKQTQLANVKLDGLSIIERETFKPPFLFGNPHTCVP